jgi:hypothetical protein
MTHSAHLTPDTATPDAATPDAEDTVTTTPDTPAPQAPAAPTTDAPTTEAAATAAADPGVPALDAAIPDALVPDAPAAPRVPFRSRRGVRAAARWSAAVLVFAVLGGATAYAVTQPERTRIPGLKTPGDGRWTYAPLALPKLPAGRPGPADVKNPGGHHYADIRSLLLTPPRTGRTDPAVPGPSGWLPTAGFIKLYDDMDAYMSSAETDELREQGLRHIAARSWTMPDGTRTDIYLLQFTTAGYAGLYTPDAEARRIKDATDTADDTVPAQGKAVPSSVTVSAHAEVPPYGATAARYAWIYQGDTIALVRQTRRGSVPEAPFAQTVRLQAQLLG